MQVGILGTGIVGRSLGRKLVQLGHNVMLGTRDPSKLSELKGSGPSACTLADWLAETGATATIGTFREAAAFGELVVNAVSGAACLVQSGVHTTAVKKALRLEWHRPKNYRLIYAGMY